MVKYRTLGERIRLSHSGICPICEDDNFTCFDSPNVISKTNIKCLECSVYFCKKCVNKFKNIQNCFDLDDKMFMCDFCIHILNENYNNKKQCVKKGYTVIRKVCFEE
jgi:hypothetical protein